MRPRRTTTMAPLTPIMRAVLVAVREIEAHERGAARRSGQRRYVWLGAQPSLVRRDVEWALGVRVAAINGPVAALVRRGLLLRTLVYDREQARHGHRYMLTALGRRASKP